MIFRAPELNTLHIRKIPEIEEMITLGSDCNLIRNARSVQGRLRAKFTCGTAGRELRVTLIGGADAAYVGDTGIGVITVLSFPCMEPVGYTVSVRKVLFPYIPGLFAFRELPLYLAAYEKLGVYPDILLVNGHGYAHPERFGMACHVGAALDIPTIGIAAKTLCGSSGLLGSGAGSWTPVTDSGETIGAVVRTRDGKKPLFISGGFRTDLPFAIRMIMASLDGNRIPRPLLAADQISKIFRNHVLKS
jgi:deoxyribonuclease V